MMNLTKIKDHPTLGKIGNAVVNIDDDGYKRALEEIKIRNRKKNEMNELNNRITMLENTVNELNTNMKTIINLLNR